MREKVQVTLAAFTTAPAVYDFDTALEVGVIGTLGGLPVRYLWIGHQGASAARVEFLRSSQLERYRSGSYFACDSREQVEAFYGFEKKES